MKLALMQPYLFPYLGYFDLINYADRWIVFDQAQYIRRGWINRNRVLHPTRGWQYFGVPVCKAPRETPIRKIRIHGEADWKKRMLNQLEHYRKTAPCYPEVRQLLESILEPGFIRLQDLNLHALAQVCEFIGLDFRYELISEMAAGDFGAGSPEDWVFGLCELTGADEYANLPGGRALYCEHEFAARGLGLTFRNLPPMVYECPGYWFEPGLSIVDVLMWNRPERVLEYLQQHRVLGAGQTGREIDEQVLDQ